MRNNRDLQYEMHHSSQGGFKENECAHKKYTSQCGGGVGFNADGVCGGV